MPIEKKRIAKNTLFLYFRMLITMIVSLYTSRIVLNVLGVEDFGIYQAVGGFVALLAFVNGSLSVGTSRFLTYELGTNDFGKLKLTFSTILSVHIILAILVIVVAETLGLWYLYNKLIIPFERMNAAVLIFHISVLTTFISITQIPYGASIISHEKMGVYAYVSIVDAFLKLGAVYLLTISSCDKLKLYSILLFVINAGIALFYCIYCINKFKECHCSLNLNKNILKGILSYSGWNLFATSANALCNQGVLVLINMFFSPSVVAARAIANQVNMAAHQFVVNFRTAVTPQIVKQFAANNIQESRILLLESTKYSYFMMLFLCVPIYMVAKPLLNIWLGFVPEYAVEFLQWVILTSAVAVFDESFYTALYAAGNVKLNSIIRAIILFTGFGVMYICFMIGCTPIACAVVMFISQFILSFIIKPILLMKIVAYPIKSILLIFVDCIKVSCIAWPIPVFFHNWINASQTPMILNLGLQIVVSILCCFFAIWFFGLNCNIKKNILTVVLKRIRGK